MYKGFTIAVVIPALDEQENIVAVVSGLRSLIADDGQALVDDIVVCDNGSADATAILASDAGARVFFQPERGYGIACLTAIAALEQPDIVVFVDGDNSVDYRQLVDLLAMIDSGSDLVIGARDKKQMHRGALSLPQRYGNRLAAWLINLLWHQSVTDLGPFRAIRYPCLIPLAMADRHYGWTVEMQVKAIQQGLRITEVPVATKLRRGHSKIGGTVKGVWGASCGILSTIVRLFCLQRLSSPSKCSGKHKLNIVER